MRTRWTRIATCALAASLFACQEPEGCTLELRPGIVVEVRDRITDEYITNTARGVVRDGVYEDSLRTWPIGVEPPIAPIVYAAAHERAGTYTVQLEAAGYQPWDTAGVRVTSDRCHVHTASLTAALEPVP